MIHPDTELRGIDNEVGVGVFATKRIPMGTITWVADGWDRRLRDDEVRTLHPFQRAMFDRYAWREGEHWIVSWDNARFVNHSCDPTCLGLGVEFEVAVRDIEIGEQLTDDYRSLGRFACTFTCRCGAPSCAGLVSPTSPRTAWFEWERSFNRALGAFDDIAQPLMPWVSERDMAIARSLRLQAPRPTNVRRRRVVAG